MLITRESNFSCSSLRVSIASSFALVANACAWTLTRQPIDDSPSFRCRAVKAMTIAGVRE